MRKYFLELFAIGLVDSEGRINTEHMTSDALMTSMKTMEELTKMKMDRLVLETTMEMILCMFESCDTEEFTEILGKLLGGKQTSKAVSYTHLDVYKRQVMVNMKSSPVTEGDMRHNLLVLKRFRLLSEIDVYKRQTTHSTWVERS